MKTQTSAVLIILVCGCCLRSSAEGVASAVTFASLLREMTDRSAVTHWPKPEYRSLQASSYNRAAKTPDDPNGWFANGDCGYALRSETNEGRQEAVLMEHDGPGVVTRIWTPAFYQGMDNRRGTEIRFYIDGEKAPRFAANMIELVTGNGPVKPPFAQTSVRAGDLYLPIPFRKSCKITQEGAAFFYIINYRAYAPGVDVESFRPEQLTQEAALLEETGRELAAPSNFTGGQPVALDKAIAGGAARRVALSPGPAAVRHLEFKLEAGDLPSALRSTVLEMTFDGEQTVWCPLGDFFSNVNGLDPAHTMWERDTLPDGSMVCRWVMPYKASASILLHNLAKTAVTVRLKAVTSPWAWTPDSFHFHTQWWTGEPYPPRPVRDMNFIEVQGRGIHVGDTLVVLNPLWSWWGEGDEKIYADGDIERKFPSHFGTGSEDYYGWAGGEVPTRRDEFSAPFIANVRVGGATNDWPAGQEPYTHGYNICTRTRSLDATPFARRFTFDMEAFNMIGTPDAYLQYALVTHWYGASGATHNRPPLPEAAARPVPQTSDVARFAADRLRGSVSAVKDAVELEEVKEVALSPGLQGGAQHIGDALPPYQWSGGGQFWGRATQVGESATFTFLEHYQPRRILLYPTQSYDYGLLNIYVNGKRAVEKWDGYDAVSKPGKPIDLGEHKPDGNVFRLKVEVAGKNPKATGCFFGLDCVVFSK